MVQLGLDDSGLLNIHLVLYRKFYTQNRKVPFMLNTPQDSKKNPIIFQQHFFSGVKINFYNQQNKRKK
jgi:hypothetical protein